MANEKHMGRKLTGRKLTDTNLLLLITVVVFFVMYLGAMLFLGKGFLKPQTFFNILNANAALIITSCGMSLVTVSYTHLDVYKRQRWSSAPDRPDAGLTGRFRSNCHP